jgi:hypothetical protein
MCYIIGMMSPLVFLLSLMLFNQCSRVPKTEKKIPSPPKKATTVVKKTTPQPRAGKGHQGNAVWFLSFPETVEIHLQHEGGQKEVLKIETKLSDLTLAPGNWKVRALSVDGKIYEPLVTGAKFNFQIHKNRPSYLGSYFIECPRLRKNNLKAVKRMEFFNRFPFTSSHGTCEMVVGNDLNRVRKAWSSLTKLPPKQLNLGF